VARSRGLAKAKCQPPGCGLAFSRFAPFRSVSSEAEGGRAAYRVPFSVSDFEQLDLEDESGPGRDARGAALDAIAEPVRDDECALVADTHVEEGFVPTLDDLAEADAEVQRLAGTGIGPFARAIKNAAVEEAAFVVDEDFVADVGRGAFTRGAGHVHEAGLLGVLARELRVDEERVFGTEFELAGAFEGLAHRAIDGPARVGACEDSSAHDDGDSEE